MAFKLPSLADIRSATSLSDTEQLPAIFEYSKCWQRLRKPTEGSWLRLYQEDGQTAREYREDVAANAAFALGRSGFGLYGLGDDVEVWELEVIARWVGVFLGVDVSVKGRASIDTGAGHAGLDKAVHARARRKAGRGREAKRRRGGRAAEMAPSGSEPEGANSDGVVDGDAFVTLTFHEQPVPASAPGLGAGAAGGRRPRGRKRPRAAARTGADCADVTARFASTTPRVWQAHIGEITLALARRVDAGTLAVIGLTRADLYDANEDLFQMGLADWARRAGTVSMLRYDPALSYGADRWYDYSVPPLEAGGEMQTPRRWSPDCLLGRRAWAGWFSASPRRREQVTRAAFTVAHELLHAVGIEHCIFLACLMNGSGSIAEDLSAPRHLCPVCLRKLTMAQRLLAGQAEGTALAHAEAARRRYMTLGRLYAELELASLEAWVAERLRTAAGGDAADKAVPRNSTASGAGGGGAGHEEDDADSGAESGGRT